MSYLLDALRKAERERKLGTVPNLATDVGGPGDRGRGMPRWVPTVVIALVAINAVAIGFALWRWDVAGSSPPAAEPPAPQASASPAAGASESGQASGGTSAPAPTAPTAPPATAAADAGQSRGSEPGQGASPAGQAGQAGSAAAAGDDGGQRAAAEPAAPSRSSQEAATRDEQATAERTTTGGGEPPTLAALPEAERRRLPELRMNGHLYSSVPGRSFVLINGRRYHEGERVAAGGAVESIDADGVVINYQGRRFRLAAPN